MKDWASEDELLMLLKEMDKENHAAKREVAASVAAPKGKLKVLNGEISLIGQKDAIEGAWPTAEAVHPLKLVLNGQVVEGRHYITPEDRIGWVAEQKEFRFDVSPDNMRVRLLLLPDGKCALKPADQEETESLVLKAAEDFSLPLTVPTLQSLNEAIQDMGIVHYDIAAIMAEVNSPTFIPVLIARGKEPVPGRDATLELFFNEQIESSYEEINGLIDYRNHLKIPSVRKGAVIARKIPMQVSEPGFDVFGHTVQANRPKDFVMLGRQHVNVAENEVIAMKDGRPRVTGEKIKMIDITTSHVITGDVDLKTGNIVFSGDVHIYGNVNDGMIVEALGDVYVSGNVYRATITATGSIYIKGNTVGSKLYSGHFGVLFNRLFTHSTKLNERLTLLRQFAEQLQQMAVAKGHEVSERQVLQILMESKFQDIPNLCIAILGCISNIQSIQKGLMDDLKNKLETMAKLTVLQQGEVTGFVTGLQRQLVQTIENIRRSQEHEVCTEIQQCHLTEIMSNGNIKILRQGVLQSRLYSKENIIFYESDSVCRGSDLEAGDTISAMIVGGVSGGRTKLKAGHKVMASLMYEGKVTVGKFSREIVDPVEHACFRVIDNRLLIDSIPAEAGEHRVAN